MNVQPHILSSPSQMAGRRSATAGAIVGADRYAGKLLLIAYHFPPDALVGAIRPAKFAKYLDRLGWKPRVLTVHEQYALVEDRARLAEVAHLPIVRTHVWPTILQLALGVRRRLTAARTRSVATSGGADIETPRAGRLKRYLNSVFELPDKQIGWLLPAVWKAYRLIRTGRIKVVVTSSPPRTTALIGLVLSYITPVRLVTDLRDPWFTPYLDDHWSLFAEGRSRLGDRIERWLEGRIMTRSALVVTTTERHAVALRQAYPWLPPDRVCTIPNGYDSEDLAGLDGVEPAATFTLSYLGTFYLHRTPRPLFEALRALIDKGTLSPADIRINLIGDVRSTPEGALEELVALYGLTDCVRIVGPVPYKQALRQMMQSHLLLLLAPNQPYSIPGKAFEYLATRKPILCLAQPGATADLIQKTGAGPVVDPQDVAGIEAALAGLFTTFQAGQPLTGAMGVAGYERRALTEHLSSLLDDIMAAPAEAHDHSAHCRARLSASGH